MSTIKFTARLLKFEKMGEKSGWTYIVISKAHANKLKPDQKKSFRVKGSFDSYSIEKVALLPMGGGEFIIPIKGPVRKILGKEQGATIKVVLEADDRELKLSTDLMSCLKEEPGCLAEFKKLPKSHQNYFSNWIDGAKTTPTKTRRIIMAIEALTKKQNFGEMIREAHAKRKEG